MKAATVSEVLRLVAEGRGVEARRVLRLAGLSPEEAAAWVLAFEGRPALCSIGVVGP